METAMRTATNTAMKASGMKIFGAAAAILALAACGQKSADAPAATPAPAAEPVAEAAVAPAAEPAAPIAEPVAEAALTPAEIEALIKTRHDGMEEIGDSFKAISDELKKGASADMARITTAADTVAAHAADVRGWFPAGTSKAAGFKTHALDAIWEKPEEFSAAVTKFETAAPALQTAAAGGDLKAIEAAFKDAGGSCKNCHDTFREDD